MRKKILIILLINFSLLNFAQKSGDAVLGKWIATDKSVAVEVYKISNQFRAKVIWFDENLGSGIPMEQRIDDENPNPKLRDRKILGLEILNGLTYDSNTKSWENGKIYDATSGRYWDSSAKMHQGLLKVRGFWKFKWIGKSMTFKRINESTLTNK